MDEPTIPLSCLRRIVPYPWPSWVEKRVVAESTGKPGRPPRALLMKDAEELLLDYVGRLYEAGRDDFSITLGTIEARALVEGFAEETLIRIWSYLDLDAPDRRTER